MKVVASALGGATWLVVAVALVGPYHEVRGEEPINRREQARRAFLATPQGVYGHYCAHCHGDEGTGRGLFWDPQMTPAPADLTTLDVDKHYLIEVIRDGSAAHDKSNLCPPWGRTISADNIERLAQHLVSLGKHAASATGGSLAASAADGSPAVRGEPFPWALAGLILAELVLLLWLILRRRPHPANALRRRPVGLADKEPASKHQV